MSSSINVGPATPERPGSSSDPATPHQQQPPLASYFVPNQQAPVVLIETSISGRPRRRMVTDELLKSYVQRDYTEPGSVPNTGHSSPSAERLKLFWSRRIGEYNGEMTPLPLSLEQFNRIAPYGRIARNYTYVLKFKTAACMFTTPMVPNQAPTPTSRSLREDYLSFIFQSVPGAGTQICISASFTFDFKTRSMYVYMHGANCANYDAFSHTIETQALSESSFFLPSTVIRWNLEQRTESLNHWHDRLYWHERKLGIRFDDLYKPDPAQIDYVTLSKDLNAANTRLAYAVWACKATARQLHFLDQVAQRYRVQAVSHGSSKSEADDLEATLHQTHAHLRVWNEGILDRAEYLSKRGQALVQTVYSGIAQRDSSTGLALASTSAAVAETSQEVAIATSRDSAVMRVIAAITIFFLPATFTATFFSTTFFQFNVDLNGRVYSPWLWLYFVVTIGLTLVVVVGTWFMWQAKEDQIDKRFAIKKGPEMVHLAHAHAHAHAEPAGLYTRSFEDPGPLAFGAGSYHPQGMYSVVSFQLEPDEVTAARIYGSTQAPR